MAGKRSSPQVGSKMNARSTGNDNHIRVGVGLVVTDPQGQLLLLRRRTEDSESVWTIPGGAVEPYETVAEALRRQLFEETGLIAADVGFSNFLELQVDLQRWVSLVFLVHTEKGDPAIGVGEPFDVIGWFSSKRLPPLDEIAKRTLRSLTIIL